MNRLSAIFIPEVTSTGVVYHPANRVAVNLAGIVGCRTVPEDRVPYIRALGIEVVEQNGNPIGSPKQKVDVLA